MCNQMRNLELKKNNPNWSGAGRPMPDSLPGSQFREPTRGMRSFEQFARRASRGVDTDSDAYDVNARWDRHRASLPKPIRSRMPRAVQANGDGVEAMDYSGYRGGWANHLRHQTPGFGPRRRKRAGAMPRFGLGKR